MQSIRMDGLVSALIVAAMLGACGGGGGGSSPPPSVPPSSGTPTAALIASQTGANQVAQSSVSAATDLPAISSVSGIPMGIQIAALPMAVSATFNLNCPVSGSATAVYSSATGSMTGVGDSVTETLVDCIVNAGTTVNGSQVATVSSWTSATDFAYSLALNHISIATNGTTYGPYSFTGAYRYANGSYSYSYTSAGGNTVVSQPVVTRSGNIITIVSGSINVNAPGGGWYNVVYNNWAWDTTTGKPTSGSVVVNGASADTANITAQGNGLYNVAITVNGVAANFSVAI